MWLDIHSKGCGHLNCVYVLVGSCAPVSSGRVIADSATAPEADGTEFLADVERAIGGCRRGEEKCHAPRFRGRGCGTPL